MVLPRGLRLSRPGRLLRHRRYPSHTWLRPQSNPPRRLPSGPPREPRRPLHRYRRLSWSVRSRPPRHHGRASYLLLASRPRKLQGAQAFKHPSCSFRKGHLRSSSPLCHHQSQSQQRLWRHHPPLQFNTLRATGFGDPRGSQDQNNHPPFLRTNPPRVRVSTSGRHTNPMRPLCARELALASRLLRRRYNLTPILNIGLFTSNCSSHAPVLRRQWASS